MGQDVPSQRPLCLRPTGAVQPLSRPLVSQRLPAVTVAALARRSEKGPSARSQQPAASRGPWILIPVLPLLAYPPRTLRTFITAAPPPLIMPVACLYTVDTDTDAGTGMRTALRCAALHSQHHDARLPWLPAAEPRLHLQNHTRTTTAAVGAPGASTHSLSTILTFRLPLTRPWDSRR